ncbi:MAG: hypothetical protein HYY07_04515 [Elusimicrobia bacterium]|nr:hypothetical protein [Elusimicrobiota bacterium]
MNKTLFQKTIYKYNEPGDLIELIPFVRDINDLIPRRFSLVEHQFLLNSNEVVIQHLFHDSRSRTAPKNSIIALEYMGELGPSFDTRVEVPLFYSSLLGFSDWYRYPMGNYTMRITESNFSIREGLYIKARTRF